MRPLLWLLLLATPALMAHGQPAAPDPAPTPLTFTWGLTLGFFQAHPATATHYNGNGPYPLHTALATQHHYHAVWQALGYDFTLHALPQAMRYNPAIMPALWASLHRGPRWALLAEATYVRLRAADQVALLVHRASFVQGDNILLYPIWGTEERTTLRLAIRHTFASPARAIHPFVEAGASLTDTRLTENRTRIEGHTISLRNPRTHTLNLPPPDGIGPGLALTAGITFPLTNTAALQLAYTAAADHINLYNNNQYLLQHALFVRVNLN